MITRKLLADIPNSTGVYIFKKDGKILYIGKALSLKARLLSHLENAKLDQKENLIIKHSDQIEYLLTDSEFKALLLEATLIQKNQPKYNLRWKDDKSYLYIKITAKEEFPKVLTIRRENDGRSLYFGPFPSQKDVQEILKTVRKMFPFCTQKRMSKKPCFYSKISLCDPCPNYISSLNDKNLKKQLKKLYRHNIRKIKDILNGKIELALKDEYKLLKQLSKHKRYEEALKLRNKIQHFEKMLYQTQFTSDIFDLPAGRRVHFNHSSESLSQLRQLLSKFYPSIKSLERIECYDVSNLYLQQATASMVVFSLGMPDKSQYRKFKIKNKKALSDFDMLEEVFLRRFKHNWNNPDLIIVDGGTPQVLKVKQVLLELKKPIPIMGIAKHPDRLIINLPKQLKTIRPSINDLGFNLIRAIRDESHRFARKYHLFLRDKRIQSQML